MRIAVIFSKLRQTGGAHQIELLNLKILNKYKHQGLKYSFFSFSRKIQKDFNKEKYKLIYLPRNLFDILNDFFLNNLKYYKLN